MSVVGGLETSSALPKFVTQAPIPSLSTCVKSLATMGSLPPLCKSPSILIPTHPVPNVVTPCTYGSCLDPSCIVGSPSQDQ